jgi:hypothetical protein
MKSFGMWKIPVMLLGLGAAVILAPTCKAQQEVSPDNFTATGVDDVNQGSQQKAAAPALKQTPSAQHVRNHQTDAPATLQLAAKRDAALPAQPGTAAVQEKRKATGRNPKKQQ